MQVYFWKTDNYYGNFEKGQIIMMLKIAIPKALKTREDGFTLVEILTVILIIGILTAIAIPVFLNQRQKAAEAALFEDMHSVKLGMENCIVANPASYPDLWINWGQTTIPACVSNFKTSSDTRTHSFDLGAYYPATGFKPGQAYCIEATNPNAGKTYYFRSDKGVYATVVCQAQ